MTAHKPCRGEVWYADLRPTRGHEQDGDRPVLVVSVDAFNHGPADLIIVAPMTRTNRNIVSHIRCEITMSGQKQVTYILTDQVRTISKMRLRRLCATVDSRTMLDVGYALTALLGL